MSRLEACSVDGAAADVDGAAADASV